jgi:hypothetical protein
VESDTEEITRQYRLNFNHREAFWDDPIPPEITSCVTGLKTAGTIDRTSLLIWSLLNISRVETADLAFQGWIRILVRTSADFDEAAFKRDVADVVNGVKQVPSEEKARSSDAGSPEKTASRAMHWPSPVQEMQAAS